MVPAAIGVAEDAPQEAGGVIEIVRGTERSSHRPGDGSIGGRPEAVEFETRRYSLSGSARSKIRREVRRLIDVYRDVLGVTVSEEFDVDLTIYGDGDGFQEALGSDREYAGFYRHDTGEAAVAAAGDPEQVRETSLHECSHAILMSRVADAPPWLNEGLAEYFEKMSIDNGRARVRIGVARREGYAARVREGAALTTDQILALTPWQWSALGDRGEQLAYTHAWSLIAYFMQRESTQRQLAGIIADIAAGDSSIYAIERHYPGGVGSLDRQWRAWLASAPRAHTY
jgi:hypothetical protein